MVLASIFIVLLLDFDWGQIQRRLHTFVSISAESLLLQQTDVQGSEDELLLSQYRRAQQPKTNTASVQRMSGPADSNQFINAKRNIKRIKQDLHEMYTSWYCWLQGGLPVVISITVHPTLHISAELKFKYKDIIITSRTYAEVINSRNMLQRLTESEPYI